MKMKNRIQLSIILLVLMLPVIATQATFVQNIFNKLDQGHNITGAIGAELKAGSHQECSLRQVCTGAFDISFRLALYVESSNKIRGPTKVSNVDWYRINIICHQKCIQSNSSLLSFITIINNELK